MSLRRHQVCQQALLQVHDVFTKLVYEIVAFASLECEEEVRVDEVLDWDLREFSLVEVLGQQRQVYLHVTYYLVRFLLSFAFLILARIFFFETCLITIINAKFQESSLLRGKRAEQCHIEIRRKTVSGLTQNTEFHGLRVDALKTRAITELKFVVGRPPVITFALLLNFLDRCYCLIIDSCHREFKILIDIWKDSCIFTSVP